jgi:hypothetical protein
VFQRLWDTLARFGGGMRLLNHPGKTMRRYELLKMLSDTGQNRFGVRRLGETLDSLKFPVFLRIGNDHAGPSSGLLSNMDELRGEIWVQRLRRANTKEMLVIEFCDTADATGLYRKYSAFRVGGRLIPRHVFFSRHWVQKDPDLLSEEQAAEQMAYLRGNPHSEMLNRIFSAAGIDYGRIDYGLLNDKVQAWEINTNPLIIHPKSDYPPQAVEAQTHFVESLAEALTHLEMRQMTGKAFQFTSGFIQAARAERRSWLSREHSHKRARQCQQGREGYSYPGERRIVAVNRP